MRGCHPRRGSSSDRTRRERFERKGPETAYASQNRPTRAGVDLLGRYSNPDNVARLNRISVVRSVATHPLELPARSAESNVASVLTKCNDSLSSTCKVS
jgi:hypothetical protein